MASWPREQWPLWDQRVLSQHPIVYNLSSSFSQGGITAAAWNQSCACLKRYGTFCYVSKRDPVAEFAAPVAAGVVFTLSISASALARCSPVLTVSIVELLLLILVSLVLLVGVDEEEESLFVPSFGASSGTLLMIVSEESWNLMMPFPGDAKRSAVVVVKSYISWKLKIQSTNAKSIGIVTP